jgi:hypothetical protein
MDTAQPPPGTDDTAAEPPAGPEAAPSAPTRRRRAAVWALIVTASLIGVLSVVSSWVNQQVLDNQSWRSASARLIQDPQVRSTLSTYLVDELYSNIDVGAELEQQLPNNLKALAGPVSAALRQPATEAVGRLLVSPRVQQLWVDASGTAHQKLVNVLENKTGSGIATGKGVVTVNLGVLVRELGNDLGLPSAALDKLPADTGVITVMRSDQLGTAQNVVQGVKVLDAWLSVVVMILFGIAIYVARGFRRETLRNIGWAFVLVGLTLLVLRRVGGDYVVNSLVALPNRGAAHSAWATGTGILRHIGRDVVFYGVVGILCAVLAGPTAPATAVRRWMAPVLNRRPGIAWGIVVALYLVLVLTGVTYEMRQPLWILILGAIVAVGFEALRRASLREFPDSVLDGDGTPARSVRDRVATAARTRRRRDEGPAPVVAPADRSAADEIARLGELHDAGVISDDEFDRGKTRALA